MDGFINPYRVKGVENLESCFFNAKQFIDIGLPLALGNEQSVFLSQVKTDILVATEIIFIRNGFCMIINPA